jgi:hypothetical protein
MAKPAAQYHHIGSGLVSQRADLIIAEGNPGRGQISQQSAGLIERHHA